MRRIPRGYLGLHGWRVLGLLFPLLLGACTRQDKGEIVPVSPASLIAPSPLPVTARAGGAYLPLANDWVWGKCESDLSTAATKGVGDPTTGHSLYIHAEVDAPWYGLSCKRPGSDPLGFVFEASRAQEVQVGAYRAITAAYHGGKGIPTYETIGVYWFLPDIRVSLDFNCRRGGEQEPINADFCTKVLKEVRGALPNLVFFGKR